MVAMIRPHARLFTSEQHAGATHAGLDLVEHQQEAMLVAQCTQLLQVLRRNRANATLALDRLDQDGRGFRPDRRMQCLVIAEGEDVEAR